MRGILLREYVVIVVRIGVPFRNIITLVCFYAASC